MTKFADSTPPYCASCYGRPDGRYIDFEAAYDGPVIPGAPHTTVDDLILCEGCLKEAFAILDPEEQRERIAELEGQLQEKESEIAAKDRIIKGAESTISELVDHPIKPPAGKPPLVGLTMAQRKAITRARYKRRGSTSDPTQKKKAVEA